MEMDDSGVKLFYVTSIAEKLRDPEYLRRLLGAYMCESQVLVRKLANGPQNGTAETIAKRERQRVRLRLLRNNLGPFAVNALQEAAGALPVSLHEQLATAAARADEML